MTTLKKITLSNIRRFAENVEINVSDGATIILAPNGTGKTSIFEGIEFALTGGVRRLGHPPLPIIRDQFDSARIRLDYDQEQFCEVNFHKDSAPVVTREHTTLFRGVEVDNIPYLLRLTHLLNQNSKEWFVQSKSDEAASQLDSLSIGKDATIANSSVVSLKRAAGSIVDKLQQEFNVVDAQLVRWNELQGRRRTAISPSHQNLTTREVIIRQILGLERDLFPQGLVDEIAPIKAAIALLQRRYKQNEELINAKIILLIRLKPAVEGFSILSGEYASLEGIIANKAKLLEQLDKKISDDIKQAGDLRITSEKWHGEIQSRQSINELLHQLAQLTEKTTILEKERSNAAGEAARLENEYETRSIVVKQNRVKLNTKQKIDREKLQHSQRVQQLSKLNDVVIRWGTVARELSDLNGKALAEAKLQVRATEDRLNPQIQILSGKEQILKSAELTLRSLISSSDKIKAAVSQVAINLAPDAKSCPVCNTNFEEGKLQSEVAISLSRLDKSLEPAHAAVRDAKKQVDEEIKAVQLLQDQKQQAEMSLKNVENSIAAIERQIDNEFKVKFQSDDLATNRAQLEKERLVLEDIYKDIVKQESELGEINTETIQQNLESELAQLQQRINDAKGNLQIAVAKISENNRSIENCRTRLQDQDHDDNNAKLLNAEQQYATVNVDLGKLQERIKGDQTQRALDKQQLGNREAELQQLKTRMNEVVSEWKQRELHGSPEISILNKEIETQQLKLTTNKERSDTTDRLSVELDKWDTYESYFAVEKDIRDTIGIQSEEEYAAALNARHIMQKLKLDNAKAKTVLINTFSRNLDVQLKSVNEKLASINPIWSRILKRLVIDPRFASTQLNSYQSYRKNYAEVKVPMHNNGALVSQVASEAQITDIQFSFLLAMAQVYQWSPWKALLLDDPTQHHDLVHASAVFDLLRDYIADHQFQVVMATHDAVQAKFFKRKLENDGIPVSFYVLNATRSGVVAEQS